MSFEVIGKLIQKSDTQVVSDRFKKREFVLELEDNVNGNIYTNYARMQCVQAKTDILDRFNDGDMLKVTFNIKGNKWERDGETRYITSLDAWRIEAAPADGGTGGGDMGGGGYGAQQGGSAGGGAGYNAGGGGYNNANNSRNNTGGGYNGGGAGNAPRGGGGSGAPAGGDAGGVDDLPF